jgi:hypothetical protein
MRLVVLGFLVVLAVGPQRSYADDEKPFGLNVQGWTQKITRESCAKRAIAAMAKEKFLRVEVDADGNVSGFSETTAVVVLPFRHLDGTHILVACGGRDNDEANRLRDAIRKHIAEGSDQADTPRAIGAPDTKRGRDVPFLCWTTEDRPVINLLRFFEPTACVLLEKQGMASNISNKGLVFGVKNDQGTAAFLALGPNAISIKVGAITLAPNEQTARDFSRMMVRDLVKFLYE